MSDLSDLYQEVILDHNRRPHNFRVIDPATATQEGYNPLCGDRLTLYLTVKDDVIVDAAFQGSGCAISKASASLMTDAVKGKSVAAARQLFERFHEMITSAPGSPLPDLGKLAVLAGVLSGLRRVAGEAQRRAWRQQLQEALAVGDQARAAELQGLLLTHLREDVPRPTAGLSHGGPSTGVPAGGDPRTGAPRNSEPPQTSASSAAGPSGGAASPPA